MTTILVQERPIVRLDELDVGMTFLWNGKHYVKLTNYDKINSINLEEELRLVALLPDFAVISMPRSVEVEPTACEMKITEVFEGAEYWELS